MFRKIYTGIVSFLKINTARVLLYVGPWINFWSYFPLVLSDWVKFCISYVMLLSIGEFVKIGAGKAILTFVMGINQITFISAP